MTMISSQLSLQEAIQFDNGINSMSRRFFEKSHEDMTLETLCDLNDINADFFVDLMTAYHSMDDLSFQQLEKYPIDFVIDYLKRTHQFYLFTKLPELDQQLYSFIDDLDTRLATIVNSFFHTIQRDLRAHIKMEESVLFPYIIDLQVAEIQRHCPDKLVQEYKNFSTNKFEEIHEDEVELKLEKIRKLLVSNPENLNKFLSLRVFLTHLEGFEKDLRFHAKVEDDLLLPKAKVLEKRLF